MNASEIVEALKPHAPDRLDVLPVVAQVALEQMPDRAHWFADLIFCIGEVETRWGRATGHAGSTGPSIQADDEHGWGLMQIDDRSHGVACAKKLPDGTRAVLNPLENVRMGAEVLRGCLASFPGNIQAAISAYNHGPTTVRRRYLRSDDPEGALRSDPYVIRVLAVAAHRGIDLEQP